MPGTSGRLHKTDDGGWVWSDDEMVEEYEGEEDRGKKVCTKEITIPICRSRGRIHLYY